MSSRCAAEARTSSSTLTFLVLSITLVMTAPVARSSPTGEPRATKVRSSSHPLSFEVNKGQTDPSVRFLARASNYTCYFTKDEMVMSRPGLNGTDVVRMRFAGGSKRVRISGREPQAGKTNYFLGNDPARWHRDVANYAAVKYSGVYPGIDVVYYGNQRQLEYDIIVGAGANPERIALAFEGVKTLSIDQGGNLVLETPGGTLVQQKPVIYQNSGTGRESVAGRYVLLAGQRAGFAVAGYDKSRPLVIDPVLHSSTYLGGAGNDIGRAIAIDSAGNSYITGETNSLDFPGAITSGIQPANAGGYDVFVTKFNAAGSARLYTTYLGGSHHDFGFAIAVDGAGNAYVTGETSSPTVAAAGSSPFPRMGPFQNSYGLGGDAFITKINVDGNALLYSSYYGHSGTERGYGIAVDSAGSAYVTGSTNSTTLPGGAVQVVGNSVDSFVAKVNAAGSGLVYSVYLGGNGSEASTEGGGIAVDSAGDAYVAGTTASTNFPGTSLSTIQSIYGGEFNDGYVAKLNATGAVVYGTYLGGLGREQVYGIAIDSANNAYVTGVTDSTNFPTKFPLQAARAGVTGNDAFITKINAAGSALLYSTYLGGTGGDIGYAIAVDGSNNAYVSGWTGSTDFRSESPIQASNAGSTDMFVTAINSEGSLLLYSTYLGGSNGAEHGYGIAVDGAGNARVTGSTSSTNFPTVSPALQPMIGGAGSTDAFVVTIAGPGPAIPTGFSATATTLTNIELVWNASPGAVTYEILRNSGSGYMGPAVVAGTSYTDIGALAGIAYVYKIRAVDSLSQPSLYSMPDVATTIFFTDDPIIANVTVVKAVHIQQLRQAVNAIRTTANLSTVFPDPFINGAPVKASHVEEIRFQLTAARSSLGLSQITFSDTLIAGTTIVKAAHIEQPRAGVK